MALWQLPELGHRMYGYRLWEESRDEKIDLPKFATMSKCGNGREGIKFAFVGNSFPVCRICTLANLTQSRPLPHLPKVANLVQIYFSSCGLHCGVTRVLTAMHSANSELHIESLHPIPKNCSNCILKVYIKKGLYIYITGLYI